MGGAEEADRSDRQALPLLASREIEVRSQSGEGEDADESSRCGSRGSRSRCSRAGLDDEGPRPLRKRQEEEPGSPRSPRRRPPESPGGGAAPNWPAAVAAAASAALSLSCESSAGFGFAATGCGFFTAFARGAVFFSTAAGGACGEAVLTSGCGALAGGSTTGAASGAFSGAVAGGAMSGALCSDGATAGGARAVGGRRLRRWGAEEVLGVAVAAGSKYHSEQESTRVTHGTSPFRSAPLSTWPFVSTAPPRRLSRRSPFIQSSIHARSVGLEPLFVMNVERSEDRTAVEAPRDRGSKDSRAASRRSAEDTRGREAEDAQEDPVADTASAGCLPRKGVKRSPSCRLQHRREEREAEARLDVTVGADWVRRSEAATPILEEPAQRLRPRRRARRWVSSSGSVIEVGAGAVACSATGWLRRGRRGRGRGIRILGVSPDRHEGERAREKAIRPMERMTDSFLTDGVGPCVCRIAVTAGGAGSPSCLPRSRTEARPSKRRPNSAAPGRASGSRLRSPGPGAVRPWRNPTES